MLPPILVVLGFAWLTFVIINQDFFELFFDYGVPRGPGGMGHLYGFGLSDYMVLLPKDWMLAVHYLHRGFATQELFNFGVAPAIGCWLLAYLIKALRTN